MTITVTTPPAATLLTTVPRVQIELGIEGDATRLLALIQAGSQAIERYCHRAFAQARVTETLGVEFPTTMLGLSRTPVVTVHEVTYNGAAVDSTLWNLDDAGAGLLQKPTGWSPTAIVEQSIVAWPSGDAEKIYAVDYTGGYILPSFPDLADAPDLPGPVELACIEFVRSIVFRKQDQEVAGPVLSERIGDYAVTYGSGGTKSERSTGLPEAALDLLAGYRRAVVA